jgi:hypothetical protein
MDFPSYDLLQSIENKNATGLAYDASTRIDILDQLCRHHLNLLSDFLSRKPGMCHNNL